MENINLTIVAVRNPKYANVEQTIIDCEVNFAEIGFEEWTPFSAVYDDVTIHGQRLWDQLKAGDHGTIGPYEGPINLGYTLTDPETGEEVTRTHEEQSYKTGERPNLEE